MMHHLTLDENPKHRKKKPKKTKKLESTREGEKTLGRLCVFAALLGIERYTHDTVASWLAVVFLHFFLHQFWIRNLSFR
jgi:hypothetical protein